MNIKKLLAKANEYKTLATEFTSKGHDALASRFHAKGDAFREAAEMLKPPTDPWDALCEEHEEMLDRDCEALFRIVFDLTRYTPTVTLTDQDRIIRITRNGTTVEVTR